METIVGLRINSTMNNDFEATELFGTIQALLSACTPHPLLTTGKASRGVGMRFLKSPVATSVCWDFLCYEGGKWAIGSILG